MATSYIGIRLGSTNTSIYVQGNGIVLKEASLVAIPKNSLSQDVIAIGNSAKEMIGKNTAEIAVISPISSGIVKYENLAVQMLKYFLKKLYPEKIFNHKIKAIVSTPIGLNDEEKKNIEILCFKSGISDVVLIPDTLCFAVGSGIDFSSEETKMVVSIGGETTNIATISNLEITNGINIGVGGFIITIAIAKFIEENFNIKITKRQAEEIKCEICSLYKNFDSKVEVIGKNTTTGEHQRIIIDSMQVYPVVTHYFDIIIKSIQSIFDSLSDEQKIQVKTDGINIYGGTSNITGLSNYFYQKTGIKANVLFASKSNILGFGEIINNPHILKRITKNL